MLFEVLCLYYMKIAVKLVQENRTCKTSGIECKVVLLFLKKSLIDSKNQGYRTALPINVTIYHHPSDFIYITDAESCIRM